MSDDDVPDGDEPVYEVGYKRPPKDHQFRKGKSGNPKGDRKAQKGSARSFERTSPNLSRSGSTANCRRSLSARRS